MFNFLQVILIVLSIWSVWIVVNPLFLYITPKQRQPKPTTQTPPKKVRFKPIVRITAAGGNKKDRYNPDLRSTVTNNAQLAASVGGAKKLAELSLLEAEELSSSSSM